MAGVLTMGKEQKRTSVPAEFLRPYFRYLSRGATLSEDYKRDLALVASRNTPRLRPRLRYEHVLVERDAVIAADEAASRQEFDAPEWLIEHALGWIAYRNPNRFRLLAREAPSRPPGARATYPLDFVNHNPTFELEAALSSGRLIARPSTRSWKFLCWTLFRKPGGTAGDYLSRRTYGFKGKLSSSFGCRRRRQNPCRTIQASYDSPRPRQ